MLATLTVSFLPEWTLLISLTGGDCSRPKVGKSIIRFRAFYNDWDSLALWAEIEGFNENRSIRRSYVVPYNPYVSSRVCENTIGRHEEG